MCAQRTDFDVIIIGGGVAGLAAASFLSSQKSVLVLERESQPAYHSSGRSAALYIEGYENPVVSALTQAGREFFFSPSAQFTDVPLLKARGGLTIAEPGDEQRMVQFLRRWQPLCPRLCAISPADARSMVPVLRAEQVVAACFDPDWYSIDVHALLMGYRRTLLESGGEIRCNAQVRALTRIRGRWQFDAGTRCTAEVVINAGGAWASSIGRLAGLGDIPLQPLRRTAVLIPADAASSSWPVTHTLRDDLYFKPEGNGLMLCPEDETPSEACDAQPEELDVARVIENFNRLTTMGVDRLLHRWAGLRTFVPDRRPVVGFDSRAEGFFWFGGLGGFGVQTSPAVGQLVADAVISQLTIDPTICVDRFVSGTSVGAIS